jgi:hypothetical protein
MHTWNPPSLKTVGTGMITYQLGYHDWSRPQPVVERQGRAATLETHPRRDSVLRLQENSGVMRPM